MALAFTSAIAGAIGLFNCWVVILPRSGAGNNILTSMRSVIAHRDRRYDALLANLTAPLSAMPCLTPLNVATRSASASGGLLTTSFYVELIECSGKTMLHCSVNPFGGCADVVGPDECAARTRGSLAG